MCIRDRIRLGMESRMPYSTKNITSNGGVNWFNCLNKMCIRDSTISIETCHPDETGKYTEATYDSLVKLTAALRCV